MASVYDFNDSYVPNSTQSTTRMKVSLVFIHRYKKNNHFKLNIQRIVQLSNRLFMVTQLVILVKSEKRIVILMPGHFI